MPHETPRPRRIKSSTRNERRKITFVISAIDVDPIRI